MKLYLSYDELRLIRNALYTQANDAKSTLNDPESRISGRAKDNIEEALGETEKLIAYLTSLINTEPI